MTRIDIKMMHSTELRELRSMIREELDFRAEVGKEINEQQAGIRNYVDGSFEHMVNNKI
jgi:predicted transcriptional regulator